VLELAEKLQSLHSRQDAYVLVTLVASRGSTPQIVGAKMLVSNQGLEFGTVGGGKIEARCIEWAQTMLAESDSVSHLKTWNLQREIGMSCGGEVSVFFDVHKPLQWHVCLFGAGHIAQELCRVMQTWSCLLSVFDTRAEWLGKLPDAPNISRKRCENLADEVAGLPDGSIVLCITQGHGTDLPILREALRAPERFKMIGAIGSEQKARKLKSELMAAGLSEAQVRQLVCPLGLPIGNNTPPEIAISIAAQLLAVRDGVEL
jgi:xanthine dehydrogenase accessory factor